MISNTMNYNKEKWLTLCYKMLWDKLCNEIIWISISNACILGYCKLIPCTFNGNLQRNWPNYQDKHLQIKTKATLWHIVLGPVGLESLEQIAEKLYISHMNIVKVSMAVFEVINGLNFSVSQPQGRELRKRDTPAP